MVRAGIMLCALLIFASAQADDAVELSPVFVDGTRIEVLDSGVVIRERVDPLDGASLADLLSRLPGVQVRSAGGLGSYSEASLRGSSGRQVRVLLDGLPLDGGGGEAASLSLISPLLLDEVEVYKGRVPIGLGSGLAGTINLHSRRELPAPVVAAAGLGSFGQRQLDLAGQLGDAQLALGTQSADNDFHYVNEYRPYDPEDPDRTESEARQNAATRQHYGLLRWQGPIDVSVHRVNDHQQLPTQLNDASADAELETHSTALALTSPRDADWNFALSHRRSDEVFRDPNSQIGLGAQQTHSRTDRSLLSVGRDLAH
jgi:outer membrane cobalamin receptor